MSSRVDEHRARIVRIAESALLERADRGAINGAIRRICNDIERFALDESLSCDDKISLVASCSTQLARLIASIQR